MQKDLIVRAWKDPSFRATLDASAVPANPAGASTLASGDATGELYWTSPRCTDYGPVCSIGPRCPD